jgi:hypothetical protein
LKENIHFLKIKGYFGILDHYSSLYISFFNKFSEQISEKSKKGYYFKKVEGGGGQFILKFILHKFIFLKKLFKKIKFTEA